MARELPEASRMMRILVVDDDRAIRRTLEKFLSSEGYEVITAADGREALAQAAGVDLVLLDLGLPELDGLEVLDQLNRSLAGTSSAPPTVIVVSARDDMQSTVRAIQLGAYEYLVKPLDIERVRLTIRRAIESREATRTLRQLVSETATHFQVGNIIGHSPAMREVYKSIGAVSTSKAAVLILGESGTGKELVARAIHYASADREKPFVAVNCTALAPGLLESELFGHVRGAFTGAIEHKLGRFELAGSGTLFLDEVAEIPIELQAKLLRVLQERTFERVGEVRPLPLRARIIAATHRDLARMVAQGSFREDLYYRLKVVELRLPPLRERRADIPALAQALLQKICQELHKPLRFLSEPAMALLEHYDWPGNVRELENALTRAVVLAKSELLLPEHLPIQLGQPPRAAAPAPMDDRDAICPLREIERQHIERVLRHTGWNKRRACLLLEISRPTLDRKIEEFGLERQDG